MEDYELKKSDFIPFLGVWFYYERNAKEMKDDETSKDVTDKMIRNITYLGLYNTGLTFLSSPFVYYGLERLFFP